VLALLLLLSSVLLATLSRLAAPPPAQPAAAPLLADVPGCDVSVVLYASALHGKNAMPAKGGNPALADADVKAAVDYMVGAAK
jgi:hypothetical protein